MQQSGVSMTAGGLGGSGIASNGAPKRRRSFADGMAQGAQAQAAATSQVPRGIYLYTW